MHRLLGVRLNEVSYRLKFCSDTPIAVPNTHHLLLYFTTVTRQFGPIFCHLDFTPHNSLLQCDREEYGLHIKPR